MASLPRKDVDETSLSNNAISTDGAVHSNTNPPSRDSDLENEKDNVAIQQLSQFLDPDPNDTQNPQNWSTRRKTTVFLALMSSSILCDGGITWGASLFGAQTVEWNITFAKSSTSINYGLLLNGLGGVFAVPFIESFGRYPIWILPQIVALAVILGATLAPTFASFVAFRTLQGAFATIPQVVGLPMIHDMYAPKDWPRMINIWGTTFIVGPFLGPALAGYLADALNWRGAFAILVALYAVSTILVLVFGRETYYVPTPPGATKPKPQTYLQSLVGRGGSFAIHRPSFTESTMTLLKYIVTWPMLLVGISMMINFTWPIGITVTVDSFIRAPPYLMDDIKAASMRFAAVIGALIGWAIGYVFNEWVSKTQLHKETWRPEFRLHGVWIPAFCEVCGLLLFGLSLQFSLSWVAIAFGWCGVNIGLVGTMVAITAFVLDKYPEHSTKMSAILNMWRTCGGFSVSYFQGVWVAKVGVGAVFGTQAATIAFSIVVLITPVIIFGRRKLAASEPVAENIDGGVESEKPVV